MHYHEYGFRIRIETAAAAVRKRAAGDGGFVGKAMRTSEIHAFANILIGKLRIVRPYLFALAAFLFCSVLLRDLAAALVAIPFFILVFVAFTAYEAFANQNLRLLSQMPLVRQEPTFVIDRTGRVVVSMGPTQVLFKRKGIESLEPIFASRDAELIAGAAVREGKSNPDSLELFSPALNKWYNVQHKSSEDGRHRYVWLLDISQRKRLDSSLSATRRFSQDVVNNLDEVTRKNDVYERLANLMFQ